ncbi:hypothetical protein VNO77_02588 [Canavalia gladiata]|uniref:Uncharacterized protein n=1 Tax=Canavalia gladiata TaxID=3824 RepID=A0AAN9MVC0_CANGL
MLSNLKLLEFNDTKVQSAVEGHFAAVNQLIESRNKELTSCVCDSYVQKLRRDIPSSVIDSSAYSAIGFSLKAYGDQIYSFWPCSFERHVPSDQLVFIDCLIDYNTITDLFLQRNLIHEATTFLLDVLKPNLPKHGFLQTKVTEINLVTFPNVANVILVNGMFSHYDRPRVAQLLRTKNFLMEAKLPDARPLINVCDRFGFVPDLTHYLYTNNMHCYIEGYDQKVNPGNAPLPVGQLLDDECPEDFIEGLIFLVRSLLSVEPLVEEDVVWSQLAKVKLGEGLVSDAIESFIRADNVTHFLKVIKAAEDANIYHDLFILMPNVANLPNVGDRLYDEALYEAAKIILAFISNCAKLVITLVKLQQFQGAVDASKKANSSKTWKEVCVAYVDAEDFRLAQISGLNVIIQVDDLEEVREFYHNTGCFNELISLRESGLGLERGHMGIFTELRVLYARHCHEKLMEHVKLFSTRLNIPKLIRACDEQQHWKELTFLYIQYDEFDNAATTIMNTLEKLGITYNSKML